MKPQNYQIFLTQLKTAVSSAAGLRLFVAYGDSEFFLNKALMSFRSTWEKSSHSQATILEEEKIHTLLLPILAHDSSLFDESSLYILRRTKKQKELAQVLSQLSDKTFLSGQTSLWLSIDGKVLASLEKELKRLNATLIPCHTPHYSENSQVIRHLAKRQSLPLSDSAIQCLLELGGADFYKIENEIQKLAFLFAAHPTPLQADDISEHLGAIRAEHVFKLTEYLIAGQKQKATFLIEDLLQRQESPLAILGILAKHCRNHLKYQDLKTEGQSSHQISSSIKIPSFLLSSYERYSKSTHRHHLLSALKLCQRADIQFKTSSQLPAIHVLSPIISQLS